MKKFLIGASTALGALVLMGGAPQAQAYTVPGATAETICVATNDLPPTLAYTFQAPTGLKGTPIYRLRFEREGEAFGSTVTVESTSGTIAFPTSATPADLDRYLSDGWEILEGEPPLISPGSTVVGTNGVKMIAEVVDTGDGDAVYASAATPITLDETTCVISQPPQSINIDGFTVVCVKDAPFIAYDITLQGIAWPGQATLTFSDINGNFIETVVVTSQSGEVIYPGAEVDAAGNGVDWPGWKLADDGVSWEPDPSDEIYRQGIVIEVEVNPTAETTVTYPPATEVCANPPEPVAQQPPPAELPSTGLSTFETGMRMGALLLIGGLGFVIVSRRRRFSAAATA